MRNYTWEDTTGVERRGEAILDAVFGSEFIIVKATRSHQRQKFDRFHLHRRDGRRMYRVDYKVDRKANETCNLALEHVSVKKNGRIVARGWVHTTIAHYVVFYVARFDTAYVLEIAMLRERWAEIQAGFELRETGTEGRYNTEFYAVPIAWLRRNRFFVRELEAAGAQYRLDLKYPRN